MKTIVVVLGLLAALPAAAPNTQIASRAYLIGKWNCSFTVGSQRGVYTSEWFSILQGAWLKQTIDQPALKRNMMSSKSTDPAAGGFQAEYFVGFDQRRQGWVRFGAMSTGQYFAIRMRDLAGTGWAWKYVSFFPPKRPATNGDDATFLKRSDTRYTIDGPSYREGNGPMVTEHHVCVKL